MTTSNDGRDNEAAGVVVELALLVVEYLVFCRTVVNNYLFGESLCFLRHFWSFFGF